MKTFEDFFKMKDHLEIDHYTLEALEEEARKWVEHYRKFYEDSMKKNDFITYPNAREAMCAIEFINHFFNLK